MIGTLPFINRLAVSFITLSDPFVIMDIATTFFLAANTFFAGITLFSKLLSYFTNLHHAHKALPEVYRFLSSRATIAYGLLEKELKAQNFSILKIGDFEEAYGHLRVSLSYLAGHSPSENPATSTWGRVEGHRR